MHKIDRFSVFATVQGALLFAWAPSSHLARAVNGHLFIEQSAATKHLVVASFRDRPLPQQLDAMAGVPKRYGDILVQLDRDEHGAIALPAAELWFEKLSAALHSTVHSDQNCIATMRSLIGGQNILAELVEDWRAFEYLQHPGRTLFPGPDPQRYAF